MLDTLRRLLPDSTAWRLVVDRLLKEYLTGVVSVGVEARSFIDDVYDDIHPQTTRRLTDWQEMFGLDAVGTEQQQRDDLAAEWAAQGGQSPGYLQSVLHAAGFTQMYVHDSFKQLSIDKATPDGTGYKVDLSGLTPYGFDFGNGGEYILVIDDASDSVLQYRLNVPWSAADGATILSGFPMPETDVRGVRWKHSGDGFFVIGYQTDLVREYTMSTRWDVSTAVAGKTHATGMSSPRDLAFNGDGTVLSVVDTIGAVITEWTLTTPWDLDTAVLLATTAIAEDTSPQSLEWGERGEKLYVLGGQNNQIYQYTTATPYRVAGMSYDAVALDIATAFPSNGDPTALRLGGKLKLYIGDLTDKCVYQWSRTLERHNPRDYTNDPTVGLTQCGESDALCGESEAMCDRLLANEVWYIINKKLTKEAPAKVPEDPLLHGHFWYVGGQAFGDTAAISSADRNRFEKLLLKTGPTEQWIVTLVEVDPANVLLGNYQYDSSTGGTTGECRFNTIWTELINTCNLGEVDQDTNNNATAIDAMVAGDKLRMAKASDETQYIEMTLTGDATDQGTYWDIPVEGVIESPAWQGFPSDGTDVKVYTT